MSSPEHLCPYCGRPLQWVADRWFGRGTFECEQCGEFPDMTAPASRPQSAIPPAAQRPVPRHDGRPRLLLVDDSAEYRDLYALALEQTATVITASSGEDALAIAGAEHFDVIVLDVMMPGLDGWQTCKRLKSNPATRTVPVIMLTSLDGLDVPATATRLGAASVLIKPCSVERLSIAIREAIAQAGVFQPPTSATSPSASFGPHEPQS
jgi:CheY-like chemotaxis protein